MPSEPTLPDSAPLPRKAGVLLHPTSLPGPGPCGDLGDGAIQFLDWLSEAGCTLWQLLPLHPVGGGFSPYASPSAMAGGTHLLSIERLVEDGLLRSNEAWPAPSVADRTRVDPGALSTWHTPLVDLAATRLAHDDPDAIEQFIKNHSWSQAWALFRTLCRVHGVDGWYAFPDSLRDRDPDALERASDAHKTEVQREIAAQILFARQWAALRAAAELRDIHLVGDVPIFVAQDGADTWAHRELFRGEDAGEGWRPDPVTGVPPDYFSPTGQCWNNPHYDWAKHRDSGWQWWLDRFRRAFELSHVVRVDHFRGFCEAWEIPRDAESDARKGAWAGAPGRELFDALAREQGDLPLIAEDLGHITPDVLALRDDLGLPGMKILQFAFSGPTNHPFLPHTWTNDRWVAYTGTHDNQTARGWYDSADGASKHRYRVYAGRDGGEVGWDLVRLAWSSTARWAVTPMQDLLGLDDQARMNTPGEAKGNWLWRAERLPRGPAERLRLWTDAYGRNPRVEAT